MESSYPDTLQTLLRDDVISKSRVVHDSDKFLSEKAPTNKGLIISGIEANEKKGRIKNDDIISAILEDDKGNLIIYLFLEEEENDDVHSFEISAEKVEVIKSTEYKFICRM